MTAARHIRLQGFTLIGRHEMIARLRDAFQYGHADLIDFQMFSNAAINFSFEVAGHHLTELGKALAATQITLDKESVASMTKDGEADEIVNGSLNVTFIHSDPDLRIPVPPIPG